VAGSSTQERSQSDTGRAEAFSDAVLAIIITLLALDLRPPQVEPGQLLAGLLQQWPTYLAYVTSYLYVGVIWTNHKAAFRRIRAIDRGLHWANLGILFATGLLPFPTAVLADALQASDPADSRTAVGLYALIGAHLCVTWLGFYHYLSRHPELIEEDVGDDFFPRERTRAWLGVAGYAVAGILGLLGLQWVALAIFLILPIYYGLTSEGFDALPVPGARG
jgi:uncharacterized membrane protein